MSAVEIMRAMNPNALIAEDEDGAVCMIEDHADPDWRLYRVEIQSTPDGSRAVGFCRYNPWGRNPYDLLKSHCDEEGTLCLAEGVHGNLGSSTLDVRSAIEKTRFWCVGFSVLMETGAFPSASEDL